MTQQRIALDVMGGDDAPEAILRGALRACSAAMAIPLQPTQIVLVGDQERIRAWFEANGKNPGFAIQHAAQVVEMADSPATALRQKPDASILVCTKLVKGQAAGAIVAMGNTGAAVGAATLVLGTLSGVKRPGICVTVDFSGKPLTMLDMGANIAPKAQHLAQYGLMGSLFAQDCLGVPRPRVGLLNVGEEEGKGTDLHKEAFALLKSLPIDFVGNMEGSDLYHGQFDVVVTDGFTGNVALKLLEGLGSFLLAAVVKELKVHGVPWTGEAMGKLTKLVDYAQYGGALLLGVDGVVVIGHGRSDAVAVANALGVAARTLESRVNAHIISGLQAAEAPSAQ